MGALLVFGIIVVLVWLASVSVASADQHPGGPSGPNAGLQQCVIDTLGFFPTALTDLSPEQAQLIGQNCARPALAATVRAKTELISE